MLQKLFICQGTSARRQRIDIFSVRVKQPPVYYQSNHSKVANLLDYNKLISLLLAYVFDCLGFLSVSIDYKQYTNSIRDILLLLPFFFHIASWFNHRPNSCHRAQKQKIHACIVVLAKSVAN